MGEDPGSRANTCQETVKTGLFVTIPRLHEDVYRHITKNSGQAEECSILSAILLIIGCKLSDWMCQRITNNGKTPHAHSMPVEVLEVKVGCGCRVLESYISGCVTDAASL